MITIDYIYNYLSNNGYNPHIMPGGELISFTCWNRKGYAITYSKNNILCIMVNIDPPSGYNESEARFAATEVMDKFILVKFIYSTKFYIPMISCRVEQYIKREEDFEEIFLLAAQAIEQSIRTFSIVLRECKENI